MAAYKFPGIYPSIKDLSGVVADNAATVCAYVGEAEFGPILKPTLVTSAQDYINKFGSINSKYGYAGYSLAVAAETISANQFVRVVNVGSPEDSDRSNNAKWGAATVLLNTSSAVQPTSTGYFYEEVTAAQTARDGGLPSGLFPATDEDSAFIVMANDPNNRKFYVTVADSTINENKGYNVLDAQSADSYTVTLTVDTAMITDKDGNVTLEPGEKIVVTRMGNENLNGIFTVDAVSEESGETALITFTTTVSILEIGDYSKARVARYPAANETTFSLTVSEKVGSVMQALETYEYCTLYPAQDSYGNSMFLEDVINGTSEYIQVFVNNNPTTTMVPANVVNLALEGNTSGKFATGEEKYTALNNGWELFRDRSQIDVSILMNSGYVLKENVSYQAKMLEIAEARRDCFCLFDVPMDQTEYEDAIDWRKNIQGFNSYRGAVCSPWVKTYDAIQGRANFVMCPSAYMAKVMGSYDPWLAPAGLNRGILSSATVSPTGLTQYYNSTEGGYLYADNQINCYIKNPGSGYVIWGQRTLQAKPSALDRINVARTVIYIETVLRDAARWHLFENNTAYERMKINLEFSAFLDTVLSSEGLDRYRVICDESNNTPQVIANNQLVIDVYLWPVYCAEVIRLQTTVMGAGAEISITTG